MIHHRVIRLHSIKPQSNILESVSDESGFLGTMDCVLGNTNFSYDGVGRLTSRVEQTFPSARTTNFESYNHLDLPQRVSTGDRYIHSHYTATGQKVKVKRNYRKAGVLVDEEIINLGTVQLKDGSLYNIPHEEGNYRIDDDGVPHLEYYMKDHLGNIRVRFEDEDGDGRIRRILPAENEPSESEIISSHHYYPFGMEWTGHFYTDAGKEIDRHRYNGKELEEVGLYDYGARWYDPAVGRFLGVDPLADLFPSQSSYLYAYNNPIRFIDVDGLYGDENEANKQRDIAVNQGLDVGDIYQSGDEWGFNVINGEDSYSAFDKSFGDSPNYLDSESTTLATVAASRKFDLYNGSQWKGTNGKYYNTGVSSGNSRPFYGNQHTGSVNTAKSKAKVAGRAGSLLGLYSVGATHLEYFENMNQGYGPNMTRHLQYRYKWDQAANGTGFLGLYGAAVSMGYNLGHIIESLCNCNIQYNPLTKDFTPIEQTLMMYDRLGIDLTPQKK